jgi:CRP/FNR family transcriptional regulator
MGEHAEWLAKSDRNLIGKIPFFSDLSQEETEGVERIIRKKRFDKEQIVLVEEDTSQFMYIVYSGKVRVVSRNEDGREQIITIHKKGDFFGEMSLLDGDTEPATVIAHEEAIIGLLHKKDFEEHILNNEVIRRKIMDLLCRRLRDAWKMINVLSLGNAEHRIIIVLDHLQKHYGVKDDRGIILNLKLTHRILASYTSVTRETATRVLNRLKKAGAISTLENRSLLLRHSFFDRLREMKI